MRPAEASATTPYKSAQAHYLSPHRRDAVKRLMEEPASRAVLRTALAKLEAPAQTPLCVLDVGSGAGDGLNLLTESSSAEPPVIPAHLLDYVGLDSDEDMVATASSLHPSAAFVCADIRCDLPEDDFDLYMSCGVPYSHLTPEESTAVLARIFSRAKARRRHTAVIVDVLGRFSIEWTPQWGQRRWNYAMTFFQDATERLQAPMTFYSRPELTAVIADAARAAGVRPRHLSFTDRSILAGRHTSTQTFNPDIPPYRRMLNDLAEGNGEIVAQRLRFQPPPAAAPRAITQFFQEFSARWNSHIDLTVARQSLQGPVPAAQGPLLARALLNCERQMQQGLGAGHSLIATVIIDPS